jgi:long-chain acyl-CoA synthetase
MQAEVTPTPDTEPGTSESVAALFQQTARQRGDRPALHFRAGQRWVPISWKEYLTAVTRVGNGLLAEGVKPADRVAIWSTNRPEWQIADLGIVHAGAATVAIYPTMAVDQVRYLLQHSGSRVLFVETRTMLDMVLAIRPELPGLQRAVLMADGAPVSNDWVVPWDTFLHQGETFARTRPGLLAERWQALGPEDVASLIYTSGTTGTPKAVMLTHRNLTYTVARTMEIHPGKPDDRLLSYLPLAHVLERVVSHMRQVVSGCEVYFCPSVDQVLPLIREVRPTYLISVPRVWEKMYAGVRQRLDALRGPRRWVRNFALRAAARRTADYEQRRTAGAFQRLRWALADRLMLRTVRRALGVDQARFCISGSAPISPEILRFFCGIGVEILEGYGLTETTAPATVNRPGEARFGTVGPPLPGVEVKIAPDGEILIKGPVVFSGYFKDQSATTDALKDGWLYTGDIGRLDPDGYLIITDRKKDLFKTAGGKYVAPAAIENSLNECRGIGQAVVIGEGRPFVTALITLDPDVLGGRRPDDPALGRMVEEAVATVNKGLSHPEQIKKWLVLDGEFQVGQELTPTLKAKRKVIAEKYRAQIDALYAEKKPA